jgi:tRNA-2-methylthio-N6-dimethylallyladenosine synthase
MSHARTAVPDIMPSDVQGEEGGESGTGFAGAGAMNVQLSVEETYADITPLRPAGAVSAFLSVMRGCNNMCSFCIVPFTRGRERSRPAASILDEVS